MSAEGDRSIAALREILDRILTDTALLPARVDRAPIANLIRIAEGAVDALAGAEADARSFADHVARATSALRSARSLIALAEAGSAGDRLIARLASVMAALADHDARARDVLLATSDRALRSRSDRAPAMRPKLTASIGAPALHHLERPPLIAHVRARANDDEDDDDEREDGSDLLPDPRPMPIDPWAAQLRRVARDAMDEIGALGLLRGAEGEDPWSPALASFDQRLLNDLDALAALGEPARDGGGRLVAIDVATEVVAFAADAFTIDPARAFARAFVLGCLHGEDAVRAAVHELVLSHPDTHDAQRAALSLASSPAITGAMRALTRHESPALAALALDVLRARGEASFDVAAILVAHPSARVRRSAIACLAAAPEREAAALLLERSLPGEEDDAVLSTLLDALALVSPALGLAEIRRRMAIAIERRAPPPGAIAITLAIAGGPLDGDLLARALDARAGAVFAAEALGWHGHPANVDVLCDTLAAALHDGARAEGVHGAIARASAGAITRITGVAVEPTHEGLKRAIALRDERRSAEDSAARRAPLRLREGKPFTVLSSLDAIVRAGVPARERVISAREAAHMDARARGLDVAGWIAPLLARVAALRAIIARESARPFGAWATS